MPSNRTSFLIDGFNLYHSVVEAGQALGKPVKWLNIRALCESFLPSLGPDNVSGEFHYFSAYAHHRKRRDPEVVNRHKNLLACLTNTGVETHMARFKEKHQWCDGCQRWHTRHEEKETDVALAVKLVDLFLADSCDTAVLVTGDTDVAPAVRYVQGLRPTKRVCFLFPYARKNRELSRLGLACKISKEHYQQFQFPDTVTLADGTERLKPPTW